MNFIFFSLAIIKAFQMRYSNFLWALIFFSCHEGEKNTGKEITPIAVNVNAISIHKDSLELRSNEGLVFFNDKLFTGTSFSVFENGERSISTEYFNGKKHGYLKKWYADGKPSFESQYVDGKKQGTTKSWWRNGNLRSESHFENGLANGIQMQWYKSGAKFKRLQLVNGKEQGIQKSWRENGKIYNNYEAKNGRIFGLKRANLCYELDNEVVQYKD